MNSGINRIAVTDNTIQLGPMDRFSDNMLSKIPIMITDPQKIYRET
jgi:hypothetical protein